MNRLDKHWRGPGFVVGCCHRQHLHRQTKDCHHLQFQSRLQNLRHPSKLVEPPLPSFGSGPNPRRCPSCHHCSCHHCRQCSCCYRCWCCRQCSCSRQCLCCLSE